MFKNLSPEEAAMKRVADRLKTVNEADLKELVSISSISRIVGLDISSDKDVTQEMLEGPLLGLSGVISFIENSESVLAQGRFERLPLLQDSALILASEDDLCALFLWGAIITRAISGYGTASAWINEAGGCPNGTDNCEISFFSDAAYVFAKAAGERHGFKIPDLGVSERSVNESNVLERVHQKFDSSLMDLIFGPIPVEQNNVGLGGNHNGLWDKSLIPEG